jgi:hypothetical protein
MRMLQIIFAASITVSTASTALAADPYLLDQRDPAYQQAIEHLSNALQAIALAKQEFAKAETAYQLPGLDVQRMRNQLTPLEDTLTVLLAPEKKRMAHQTLVPDSLFFTPVKSGE